MARLPRLTLPDHLHHVIQRGNNGQAIFNADADRRILVDLLFDASRALDVAVHAYVLLDNQFNLLATPRTERGLPELMQAVGRRYVRYFNDVHGRTGTLWEGRYRSTLVQPDRYLLPCMIFIDLAAVRSGLVDDPRQHAWSSHRYYAGVGPDRLVTPHSLYWALGNTPFAREQAYADLVTAGIAPDLERRIGEATLRGWALGDAGYLDELGRLTDRRAAPRLAGRPKKAAPSH